MGDVVQLHSNPIDLTSDEGSMFVTDCCRAGEGLITDDELKEKYEIAAADWRHIAKDPALGRAIRAERERRVWNGSAAREAAAKHFVKAPKVLDQIMSNEGSNARHRIEAAKELRTTAIGNREERAAAGEKFSIVINIGPDTVERFEFDHTPKETIDLEQENDGNWG